jgi:hypothetical protein
MTYPLAPCAAGVDPQEAQDAFDHQILAGLVLP